MDSISPYAAAAKEEEGDQNENEKLLKAAKFAKLNAKIAKARQATVKAKGGSHKSKSRRSTLWHQHQGWASI